MDYPDYKRVMEGLAVNYREPLTDPLLDLFWRAFGHIPAARFAQAVSHHVLEQTFFPRVAELRMALKETAPESEQWAATMRSWLDAGMLPAWWDTEVAAAKCAEYGVSPETTASIVEAIGIRQRFAPLVGGAERDERRTLSAPETE